MRTTNHPLSPKRRAGLDKLSQKVSKAVAQTEQPRVSETADKKFNVAKYRNGGVGFAQWCHDFVRIPVYHEGSAIPTWTAVCDLPDDENPETGRSYKSMWDAQTEICKRALYMKNGRFKHRLIVLCWPRGEGKSFVVVLMVLWKFFCWPRQQIVLGANSKDQTKFIHYDIIRDIIVNSPRLLMLIGPRNVKEKEIVIKDSAGRTGSVIRAISSFSGIMSNITAYTFSEMFDMKNPKFFVQIDGSIRNIPNAMGFIDTTVSEKSHILYQLYETYAQGKDDTLFFSHRYSKDADFRDYTNPNMTQKQLDAYRAKFPPAEFDRYFRNMWNAGAQKLFTDAMVEATQIVGVDGALGGNEIVQTLLKKKVEIIDSGKARREGLTDVQAAGRASHFKEEVGDVIHTPDESLFLQQLERRLVPVSKFYKLATPYGTPRLCSAEELSRLGDAFNTNWSILCGIDRADPMKSKSNARTIGVCVAKGLANSRGAEYFHLADGHVPQYIYFTLGFRHIESSELEDIKAFVKECYEEYDGVDVLCSERWAMFDIKPWCDELGIHLDLINPTYERQKEIFSELFILYRNGRFKCPPTGVAGTRDNDLLKEEAKNLDHDPARKWYGSPEKHDRHGVQDDAMFSLGCCIYGGRELTVEHFRDRLAGMNMFGAHYPNTKLIGEYSGS